MELKTEIRKVSYVGARGSSVIDYVIGNENCNEIVKEFKVGEREWTQITCP